MHITEIRVPAWRRVYWGRRSRWLWISLGFGLGAPLGAIIGRFLV